MEATTMGLVTGGVMLLATLTAELVQIDPAAIVGTGGVGIGGWLAATAWSAYRRWSRLADMHEKAIVARLADLEESRRHREKESDHWKVEEAHLGALRERLVSNPHTPVQGIPLGPIG